MLLYHTVNIKVWQRPQTERKLINTIRKRQIQFIGEVAMIDSIYVLALEEKLYGKKHRGRLQKMFIFWAVSSNGCAICFGQHSVVLEHK